MSLSQSHALVFQFMRGDGTGSQFRRLHSVFKLVLLCSKVLDTYLTYNKYPNTQLCKH